MCCFIESQFISVLAGPLRSNVGLSDQEISDLADYFRVPDGRVFYTQLCEVIHDSGNNLNTPTDPLICILMHIVVPSFEKNENLVTGLEWDDPLQVNRLSPSEERRMSLLITKIATIVNQKKLILRPYFQDYELVKLFKICIMCYNIIYQF